MFNFQSKSALLFLMLLSLHQAFRLNKIANRAGLFARAATTIPDLTTPIKLKGADALLSKTDVFIFDCDGVIW